MKSKILILLALLTLGCHSKNDQKDRPANIQSENIFFTINIPDLWKKQSEVYLSEIADSIEYITLETSQKSLVGFISDVKFTKDFIFIEQSKGPLAQFDISGTFIRNIGHLGRGPEEYIMIREFSIDELHRRIYIQSNSNRIIQVYSFDGEYLKTIRFQEDFGYIVWSRDSLLMCFSEPDRGVEKTVFDERNSKGDIIQSVKNNFFWQNDSKYSFTTGFNLRNVYYRLNNGLHFKGWYNDTVYTFNKDNKIIPKYLLDLGNTKLPDALRPEVTQKPVTSNEFYWASVKESQRFAFILYSTYSTTNGRMDNYGLICYDKLKMDGTTLISKKGKMEFVNDLDGGPDFNPEFINDSVAFCFISAFRMKKYLETDDSQNTSSKKQEQKRMLKIKFKGLNESDNSIIMTIKLKS